jgi:hypothetical protein
MGSGVVVVVVILVLGRVSGLVSNGESSGKVVGRGSTWNAHRSGGTTNRRSNGHARWKSAVGGIETGLDEVLALRLGDQGLELGGGEGIYEAGFGDNEE